jgi:hypothetical protein
MSVDFAAIVPINGKRGITKIAMPLPMGVAIFMGGLRTDLQAEVEKIVWQ